MFRYLICTVATVVETPAKDLGQLATPRVGTKTDRHRCVGVSVCLLRQTCSVEVRPGSRLAQSRVRWMIVLDTSLDEKPCCEERLIHKCRTDIVAFESYHSHREHGINIQTHFGPHEFGLVDPDLRLCELCLSLCT